MSLLGDRKLRFAHRYEMAEGGLYLSGLQALVRIPSTSTGSTSAAASARPP